MTFEKTKLPGVYVVHFESKPDERGYFVRTYCQRDFTKAGIPFRIVQTNRSKTVNKGAVRGMHFQTKPHEEDKLIQCIKGSVYDVALDIRKDSPTFRQWFAVTLTADNHTAFFIPKGFAHGFQALEPNSELEYYMSQYYAPEHATGVHVSDPAFSISWPLPIQFVSTRDQHWPLVSGMTV